jgi:probable HAF family extracellular repeat protein
MYSLGKLPGYTQSQGRAINNSGQVVGWCTYWTGSAYVDRAFLYSDGAMIDLGTLGGTQSRAYAINDSGQIIGWAEDASGRFYVFLYSNGQMTDLGFAGGPGPQDEHRYGINNKGEVLAGFSIYSGGVWQRFDDLIDPSLGFRMDRAYDINDAGQITGEGRNAQGQYHAFLLTLIPEPTALSLLALLWAAVRRRGFTMQAEVSCVRTAVNR